MDTNYKMISSLLLAGVSTCGIARQPMQNPMEPVKERPNILVIVCEDISPYLGCYGDKVAEPPILILLRLKPSYILICIHVWEYLLPAVIH